MRILAITLILISIEGCDILTTRDSEKPDKPRSNFVTPTTPDLLFKNFSESLKEKVVENYMACFVDNAFLDKDYKFIPSAGSVAQFGALADWDLNSEKQYFNNLKSTTINNVPLILQLNHEISNTQGDSAVYQYDYILSVPFESSSISYRGNLKFNIHFDSRNHWVITRWEDTKNEEYPSWSELKGKYY